MSTSVVATARSIPSSQHAGSSTAVVWNCTADDRLLVAGSPSEDTTEVATPGTSHTDQPLRPSIRQSRVEILLELLRGCMACPGHSQAVLESCARAAAAGAGTPFLGLPCSRGHDCSSLQQLWSHYCTQHQDPRNTSGAWYCGCSIQTYTLGTVTCKDLAEVMLHWRTCSHPHYCRLCDGVERLWHVLMWRRQQRRFLAAHLGDPLGPGNQPTTPAVPAAWWSSTVVPPAAPAVPPAAGRAAGCEALPSAVVESVSAAAAVKAQHQQQGAWAAEQHHAAAPGPAPPPTRKRSRAGGSGGGQGQERGLGLLAAAAAVESHLLRLGSSALQVE